MNGDSVLSEWLDWLEHTKGVSPATLAKYGEVGLAFADHFGTRLSEATTSEVSDWLRRPRVGRAHGEPASPATQRRDAAIVRSLYRFLQLPDDPTVRLVTPKVRNVQPRPVSDELWQKLWVNADDGDALALGLGFFCGLRRQELVRLCGHHVDLGQRRLVNFVRKGGGEDVLPIGTMLDVLERRLPQLGAERLWPLVQARAYARHGDDWLIGWADLGRPKASQASPALVNKWLDRVVRRSGATEHVTPHQLRHSCATNLLRAGVPLALVSTLLNHANVQTTMRYLKTGGDALSDWLRSAS